MDTDDLRRLEGYAWAAVLLLALNTLANIVAVILLLTMIL